jgi:2-hydroxychromene-2-carboxylate isomerase
MRAPSAQLKQPDDFLRYVELIFKGRSPSISATPGVPRETLTKAGFDADAFAVMVAAPEVKAALVTNTEAAVARGAFGAPTMFIGEEMFFGQDRFDFVREALA